MGLESKLLRGLLSLCVALPACGTSEPDEFVEPDASVEVEQNLEMKILQGTTDSAGLVFSGEQELEVVDDSGTPQAGVDVTLYQWRKGDIYLSEKGGMAVFPLAKKYDNVMAFPLTGKKKLVVQASPGVTLFDQDSQGVVYDLLKWTSGNEYICNGIYTTETLIKGRELSVELISYFDPTGKIKYFYDKIDWLMEHGLLDDLPANKKWFSLTPANPLGMPLLVQRGLAKNIFDEDTYDALNANCKEIKDEVFSCSGDELFCDDFSGEELDGRWEEKPCGSKAGYDFEEGKLNLIVNGKGSCFLESKKQVTLGNGTYVFEARWKVDSNKGVKVRVGVASDKGGVSFGYIPKSETFFCGNSNETCEKIVNGCEGPLTKYQTTKFRVEKGSLVTYFVDNSSKGFETKCIPKEIPTKVHLTCQSNSNSKCTFDYVKLEKE